MKWILLGTLVLVLSACGNGGSPQVDAEGCVTIHDVICHRAGSVLTEVQGEARNLCNRDLRYVKVVAQGYTRQGGTLIGNDEEYIMDLHAGDNAFFEALIADDAQAITYCRVTVDEAVFGP